MEGIFISTWPNLKCISTSLFLLILANTVCLAQDNSIDQIKTSFDVYQSDVYNEKVFVHSDKEFYMAGELMWFKSYVTEAATNKPSILSKVLYMELLDETKRAVLQTKVSLHAGAGNGSVFLPVSLRSGSYILRAYTSWMMNFSPDFFFEKQVTILNSLSPGGVALARPKSYDIQFFPEGGTLLANVENKVAFRVANSSGVGQTFNGAVIDEKNDTIARFWPSKFGIGNFLITPTTNKVYRAVISVEGDSEKIIRDMPAVLSSGYNLQVATGGQGRIRVTVNTTQTSDAQVYLFIHNRQVTTVAERGIVSQGLATFTLDPADLSEGISHFTVFNSNLKPVAERLYFKRPQRQLTVDLQPDRGQYGLRERVNIDVRAIVSNGTAQTDMSMAVYKTDSLNTAHGSDFFNYQWLGSELKGNIEHAEYYFQEGGAAADEAADNLMLTHGWRRFQWDDVIKNIEPIISRIPEFEGHIINGMVKHRDGRPAAGIMTFLSVPSKITQIYTSRSDKDGRVRFFTKNLTGTGELVIQTNIMQDSTYVIEIDSPFSQAMPQFPPRPFVVPSSSYSFIQDRHVSIQVQNAFASEKLRTFREPTVDSLAFYGRPEFVYKLDEFVRFKTTEEILREYVPAVVIFRQRNNFNVVVDKKTAAGPVGTVPLLILDGVPIFDRGNRIMAFDPARIQKLEVLTKNSFLGDTTFNSIVNFTSFKGNLESFELDPRDLVIDYEGLQLQREFFSPVYETEAQQSSRLPDMRTLLYWSPDIKTDASGKSSVTFYTSDQSGKYTVIVQGITENGKPGSGTATFEVK